MRIHVSVRTVASMKLAAVRRHVAIGGVGAAWKLETNDRVDPRCYKGGVARCEIEEHPGNGSFGRLELRQHGAVDADLGLLAEECRLVRAGNAVGAEQRRGARNS
jgi:hypothetical protein